MSNARRPVLSGTIHTEDIHSDQSRSRSALFLTSMIACISLDPEAQTCSTLCQGPCCPHEVGRFSLPGTYHVRDPGPTRDVNTVPSRVKDAPKYKTHPKIWSYFLYQGQKKLILMYKTHPFCLGKNARLTHETVRYLKSPYPHVCLHEYGHHEGPLGHEVARRRWRLHDYLDGPTAPVRQHVVPVREHVVFHVVSRGVVRALVAPVHTCGRN